MYYMAIHQNCYPFDFENKVPVQILICQQNIIQVISVFMDQNLSWLIVNREQFQFWKSKIFFLWYTPLNSEPFLTHPVGFKHSQRFPYDHQSFSVQFLYCLSSSNPQACQLLLFDKRYCPLHIYTSKRQT